MTNKSRARKTRALTLATINSTSSFFDIIISMYYSHSCSYCTKIFYTYNSSKHEASKTLYHGIKKHLIDYDEDHKEFQFDDGVEIDVNEVYVAVSESNDPPSGGYEL